MALKSLSVEIGADTSGFSEGIRAVNGEIKSVQETIEKVSKSLSSQVDSLISEYKKQGEAASEAFKNAWDEIARISSQANKSESSKLKSSFSDVDSSAKSAKGGVDNLKDSLSETNKAISAINSGIKALVASIVTLVSVTVIIKKMVQAFRSYTSLESNINRVADLFEDSARYIQYFAQTTAKSLGMAESSVYEYAATYGNLFKNITSDTYENAKVTIAMLQASAVVASKTGRTMEDVMERIRSGLLGNTEAIEDLGINVNVAMLEVTDSFKKIADGRSWEQLTFYEQQQVRTLAILEQASGNFGKEIQQGSAFSVSVLTGALEDLTSTAGEFVNEVFQPIIKYLTTTVQNITSALQSLNTDGLQPIVNALQGVVQYAITALKSLLSIIGINITFNENNIEMSDSFSESASSSEEISDNMENTEKTAKKLKKTLAGFDELNVLSTPDTDSDSLSDIFSEDTSTNKSAFSSLPDLSVSDEPATSVEIDTSGLKNNISKIKSNLKPLTDSLLDLWDTLKPFAQNVGEGLMWFYKNVLKPLAKWTITKALPKFLDVLSSTIELLTGILKDFKPLGKWLWEGFLKPVAKWTGNAVTKSLEIMANIIKKLGEYTPAIDGIVTGLAAFAGVRLFDQLGIISKLSGAFTALKSAVMPVITAFEVAGGGFEGLCTVITTGVTTAIASFTAFMQGLSPIMKVGVAIAGVTASFSTAFSAMYDLETGSISLGEALKNIAVVIVPVGVALTAMLGPVGLAITAVSAFVGALIGATQAVKDNAEDIANEAFWNGLGTPISEFSETFTDMADNIINRNDDILSLGQAIQSNKEEVESARDNFLDLKEKISATGDTSQESAQKLVEASKNISDAARQQVQNETTQVVTALKNAWIDLGKSSTSATDEVITNMYIASANYDKVLGNLQKEIDETFDKLLSLKEGTPEYDQTYKHLDDLLQKQYDYTTSTDETAKSVENLKTKFDNLKSYNIDFSSIEDSKKIFSEIKTTYKDATDSIEEANKSAKDSLDDLYVRYQKMEEMGEPVFFDYETWYAEQSKALENGFVSQKKEITSQINDMYIYIGQQMNTQISTALIDVPENLKDETREALFGGLIEGFNQSLEDIKREATFNGIGEFITAGFADGIDKNIDQVKKSTKRMTNETKTTAKSELDEHSPSKVFKEYGQYVVAGFKNGILDNISSAISAVQSLCKNSILIAKIEIQAFPNVFKSAFSATSEHMNSFISNIKNVAKSGISETVSIIKNGLSVLSSDIGSMQNPFDNYFANILNKATAFKSDFLSSMWSVRDSLRDIFNNIFVDCWNFGEKMNNTLKDSLNRMISSFNATFQGLNSINYALSVIPGYDLSFDIPEIPYLAKGGIVSSPTLAMIGEAGREAVVPLEKSSWIDELAKKVSAYSGGSTDKEINIHLNVSAFPGEKAFQRYCVKACRNEISRGGKIL